MKIQSPDIKGQPLSFQVFLGVILIFISTLSPACSNQAYLLADHDKIYSLVPDGGVRWNSTYIMIERCSQASGFSRSMLFQALARSTDEADKMHNWMSLLSSADWEILAKIRN